MANRWANYEIVHCESNREVLVLRDLGPWDEFLTVTNDIENVVKKLSLVGKLGNGRRLVYLDSEGELTEVRVVNGRFAGFI